MSKSTRISRRTVLRGLGTAVALPWLEASLPQVAFGAETPKAPVRMAFLCVPNGKHMPDWTVSILAGSILNCSARRRLISLARS